MSKPYIMRQAGLSDVDTAMGILEQRREWLRSRNSDQWNHGREYRDRMVTMVERGHTWILEDDGVPIGTATARKRKNSTVWTPEEMSEPALYGWKMAVVLEREGERLGELILRWLQDRAANLDLVWMRWTAWRTNEELREYYRRIGAEFVRFGEADGEQTNALFQLPATLLDDTSEVITQFDETRPPRAARDDDAQREDGEDGEAPDGAPDPTDAGPGAPGSAPAREAEQVR